QADLVWIHSIRTANAAGIHKWQNSILDIDDLPSAHYHSTASTSRISIRKLLDLRMATIWRRRELHLRKRFDALVVCSPQDKAYLGDFNNIHVVANGFEASESWVDKTIEAMNKGPRRLGFIGTFNWWPNEQGIKWFVESVWPIIKVRVPDAQLRL